MNEEAEKKTMKKQTIFQRIAAVALSLAMTLGMSNLSGDLSAPVHAEEGKGDLSYGMEDKGQGGAGWAGAGEGWAAVPPGGRARREGGDAVG